MRFRTCLYCGKELDPEETQACCSEDCFYGHIYYGTPEEPGVLISPKGKKK